MHPIDYLASARARLRSMLGKQPLEHFDVNNAELPGSEAPRLVREATTDLGRLTFGHDGRVVDKWLHYPDSYDRHFARFRGKPVRMLEIGVFKGGSLEVWRNYFGPDAIIYGVDINPDCAGYVDAPNQVRIGSQDDPEFLRSVVREMGGVDIVLDDGSHIARHQEVSLRTLFPLVAPGGIYAIEDMHTAYWAGGYGGGLRRRGSAIELVKEVVDDMHGWYHGGRPTIAEARELLSVHFYDSIAFIEKGVRESPKRIKVGAQTR